MMSSNIFSKVCKWAEEEPSIRAAILVGSRASEGKSDDLSDYDISLFVSDAGVNIQDDQWLSSIGKHWVCVHEKIIRKTKKIPTRLVISEGGIKVDFSFYPVDALVELSQSKTLPDDYDAGYKALLDKDGLCNTIPKPTGKAFLFEKPSQKEFDRVVQEFWFEAYHVAKYLKRGDLWIAKFREWEMKDPFLLTMLRWNAATKQGWDAATHSQGKSMQVWTDATIWKELHACFSHFDAESAWKALEKTTELFRRVALETAEALGYSYPRDVDRDLTQFIFQMKNTSFTS